MTFQGRTLEELLPQIRDELGPNAVVLTQRPVINGGVAGFFGKRMLEVVAADRMPTDSELVELEDGEFGSARDQAGSDAGGQRRLDMVDDWDPSLDDELAEEYGSVLRHVAAATDSASANSDAAMTPSSTVAASMIAAAGEVRSGGEAGTYEPLDLPRRRATVDTAMLASALGIEEQPAPAPARREAVVEPHVAPELETAPHGQDSPAATTRKLTARAHKAIAEATMEIERQLLADRHQHASHSWPATSTFRAEVVREPARRIAVDGALAMTVNPVPEREPVPVEPDPLPLADELPPVQPDVTLPDLTERTLREAADALDRYLRAIGTDSDIAQAIVAKVVNHRRPFVGESADLRALAAEVIGELVRVETGWEPRGRAHRTALVGPSGSGKSSIIAKLAESYVRTIGYRVGVISIMPNTIAVGQHGMRTDPLLQRDDLDVHFAATPEQMAATVERMRDCDLVLIDTPSAAYLDPSVSTLVSACLAAARVDDVHAVIPLATSLREAESVIEHFRPMQLNRMIVSKIDESRFAGQLLNYGYRFGLPITYLSDGPQIPHDLRAASAQEIARLIVPHQQ